MVNFSIGYTGCVGVFTASGPLTIQQADDVREALMKLMSSSEHVVVNLEEVTELDITCLQLLCSAHRTSALLNKKLSITGNRPAIFQKLLRDAGFARHMGCSMDQADNCLWVERKN